MGGGQFRVNLSSTINFRGILFRIDCYGAGGEQVFMLWEIGVNGTALSHRQSRNVLVRLALEIYWSEEWSR
jgi:hypothetical protein